MQRLRRGAFLAGVGLCLSTTGSFGLSSRDCEGMTIGYAGPDAALAECETSRMGGGGEQGSATDEYLQIVKPGSIFMLSHAYAGTQSYMRRSDVKSMFAELRAFESTSQWGEEAEVGDFTVRRFHAKLADAGIEAGCVGFSRYSGHVARTSGYRHSIAGFYCDLDGQPPTDSLIDRILGGIEYEF